MGQVKRPFISLGERLKTVRRHAKRSVAEVSGAVEIEERQLRLIEAGVRRPDEEIMLLLISYFDMADKEALNLWDMAHYDSDLSEHLLMDQAADEKLISQVLAKPMVMLLSLDVRIMYSDGFNINWTDTGLTMNFTQTSHPKGQPLEVSVAKVGMSYTQAEKLLTGLQLALLQAKYVGSTKLLPPKAS